MFAIATFSIILLAAVLVSGLAQRSILSTAVMFLVAGFLSGQGVGDIVWFQANDPVVGRITAIALFAMLFTDGMKVGWADLKAAWRLPGRALLLGLPLTLLLNSVAAYYVVGLGWKAAFLIGAILTPTDPVLAAAIVGQKDVPKRLRQLLNVESGVNDGLVLPIVVILIDVIGAQPSHPLVLLVEVGLGIVLGIAVAWLAIHLVRQTFFGASEAYEPLLAFSIGLIIWSLAGITNANQFLAAFAGGMTIATISRKTREDFDQFGKLIAELLKLLALFLFGALVSPKLLGEMTWDGFLFVALALLVIRPITLGAALIRSAMPWKERVVATWFGPKGFSSVVYAIMVLNSLEQIGPRVFHLVAVTVGASIIVHSSTDVLLARWFQKPSKIKGDAGA